MANKREQLEDLGRRFIDLEILVLNETSTSIFENGVYNQKFLDIADWEQGIKEFLMDYEGKPYKDIRAFYQCLAELVNKAYIRYKEYLTNVDTLNLKVYLQIAEILEQEQKIYDLTRYYSSIEVIEAQEHLNKIVLNSYTNQLNFIQKTLEHEEIQRAIQVIVNAKEKEEIRKEFTDGQIKTFEHFLELVKPENKDQLEKEIKEAEQSIEEAKKRQKNYEKQRKDQEKLEELQKDKNTLDNFLNNKEAVKATIEVLERCCQYYYYIFFLNEFIRSLGIIDIQNQFYFLKPLELISYSKLQGGLEDLLAVMKGKKKSNKELEKVMYRFISLELSTEHNSFSGGSSNHAKEVFKYYDDTFRELRGKIIKCFEYKNRRYIVQNISKVENDFINTLRSEKGW